MKSFRSHKTGHFAASYDLLGAVEVLVVVRLRNRSGLLAYRFASDGAL